MTWSTTEIPKTIFPQGQWSRNQLLLLLPKVELRGIDVGTCRGDKTLAPSFGIASALALSNIGAYGIVTLFFSILWIKAKFFIIKYPEECHITKLFRKNISNFSNLLHGCSEWAPKNKVFISYANNRSLINDSRQTYHMQSISENFTFLLKLSKQGDKTF